MRTLAEAKAVIDFYGKVIEDIMNMKLSAFIFFLIIATNCYSQHKDSSTVIIHKDPRLDLLVKKQAQINEESVREAKKTARGYRLLVINTNKREEAIAAKTKVYTYFPDQKAYLLYQSPYFKVKVGNFKERKEADEFRQLLNRYFPKGVFVIHDIIEVRPQKDEELRDP